MTRMVAVSRALTAVGLVGLLVFGVPREPAPGEPLRLDATVPADTVAAILARDTSASLTWGDSFAPGRAVGAMLAAAAEQGREVRLPVPAVAGRLRIEGPDHPVAGRRTSIRVNVRGPVEAQVGVRVEGPGGRVDTLAVRTGPDGRGEAWLAVEPSRGGAATWTVHSPDGAAVVHAWVRPATPVRVLVSGGAPTTEVRYLIRALEAAGMEVEVRQELGRGLAVATPGARVPRGLDDLAGVDVLALVGPSTAAVDSLALRWVRERGGGLLLSGPVASGSPLAPWAPRGAVVERPTGRIAWAGPAEILPLPEAELPTRVTALPPGGVTVARLDGDPVVHVALLGRGRLMASAFESWPWVLRSGLAAEHRAFWESAVEWLAGGLTEDALLIGGTAIPRVRWEGRLEGDTPDVVALEGVPEDGGAPDDVPPAGDGPEVLPVRSRPDGTARVEFVPDRPAAHLLRPAPDRPEDPAAPWGVVTVDPGETLTWTAAALRIGSSGGRIVPLGARGGAVEGDERDARPPGRPDTLPWLMFLVLGGIAASGWTLRRVQGLP